MPLISFIKKNSLLFGIISLIALTLTPLILNLFQINSLWFTIVKYYLILVLVFLILISQNHNLENLNIDSFSVIILILLRTGSPFLGISADFQRLLNIFDFCVVIAFVIIFIGEEKKKIAKLSLSQILIFLFGIILGLSIAILKILFIQSSLLNLAITYPIQFGYSILLSLSLYMLSFEFIFRGFLWGFLKTKGVPINWIVVITTLVSILVISPTINSIGELINSILLYLFLGFLVKKAKSINISIGFIAGYNSFLILQSILGK